MADDHVTRPGEVLPKDKIRLPMWAWAVLGGVVLGGGYLFYRHRQAASAAATQAAAQANNPTASSAGYQTPTTILPIFQGGQPATGPTDSWAVQQYNHPPLPVAGYTVTGQVHPTDQYPGGVVMAAYGVPITDTQDIATFIPLIMLLNPGLSVPYPVGTHLRIPAWPGDPNTRAYTAQDHPDQTVPPAPFNGNGAMPPSYYAYSTA